MTQHIQIDRRFAIIDEWVLDLDISDRAIRLYAVLVRYADKDTHKAFPSRGTLAKRLHCSTKSVDRAIQELIDAGLLSKEQRFNSSLVFTIRTVSPPLSRGVDTAVQGGWTPMSRGVDTSDDLTRTTQLEPQEQEPLKKRKPKTADDYQPSQAIIEEMETRYIGLALDVELEKFKDHHVAKGSQFKDWDRAFRGWLRRAQEWSPTAKQARAWAEYEKQMEEENPDEW